MACVAVLMTGCGARSELDDPGPSTCDSPKAQAGAPGDVLDTMTLVRRRANGPEPAGLHVTLGHCGDIFVTGESSPAAAGAPTTIDVGGIDLPGGATFLAHYNATGELLWARNIATPRFHTEGSQPAEPASLASDPNGDLLLGASFTDDIIFDGRVLHRPVGNEFHAGGLIARVDSADGTVKNLFTLGPGSSKASYFLTGMVVRPDRDLLVIGSGEGPIEIGDDESPGKALSGNSISRAFLARLSPEGQPRWLKAFGGAVPEKDTARFQSLSLAPDGGAVVTGMGSGDPGFGVGNVGTYSDFTSSFDGEGTLRGVELREGAVFSVAAAMGADGTLATVGYYSGRVEIGGETLAKAGGFVVASRPAGQTKWVDPVSHGEAGCSDVRFGGDGALYVTGSASHAFEIGGASDPAEHPLDHFVARLDDAGAAVWIRRLDGRAASVGPTLLVDPSGSLLALTARGRLVTGVEQYETFTDEVVLVRLQP